MPELSVPSRNLFIDLRKTESITVVRIQIMKGKYMLLQSRIGFSFSDFCGKNLMKAFGVPRRITH